jgi:putative membrane protein
MDYGYGWGMGGFGFIFMIIFWGLILAGVIFVIKLLIGNAKGEGKTETALDILKKRYAKGEISKEEFEEKKKDVV